MTTERNTNETFREWLRQKAPKHAIAVTTTFHRDSISIQSAQSAVRMYCRMLNVKAFGNTFKTGKNRLAIIPIREGGTAKTEKRIHYHYQIEVPPGWSDEAWIAVAEAKIRKIQSFGHSQYDVKLVRDPLWLEYILKDCDKTSFADAIDVENLWLND